MTTEDTLLSKCLPGKVEKLKQLIDLGKPYVWQLRLSLEDFYVLERAIGSSISSHTGDHHHLLCEDFAVIVVMYLAEWYKRFYKGADTMDDNKVLALNTEELKKLYQLAKIDSNTFVYNASKNPDKTSYRWMESLQVLGGLAVQAELKRDENDDKLLSQLCKIFHGEEIDLDDLKDRNRAVAFQESIARQHSLYDYLDCILDKEKEMPFAKSDMVDESTAIPQFLKRILEADREAKKEKFDFEWIIAYNASKARMVRHLRVKMKPEVIGGGKKQYIGYDRLTMPEWGIEQPEDIGRIKFYLRFKNGGRYIKKEDKNDEPLFKYDNDVYTHSFLSVNKIDENTYTDVPVGRFDKVEMVMKYDIPQADGSVSSVGKVVQDFEVLDYMQVYALPKTSNKFSSRRNSQAATAVIFSSAYHLTEPFKELPVVYAHYSNGDENSEDYCWCPINDKVIIADANGKEILPPFFNRNGLYQVVTKKYLQTIKYQDNVFVLYKYVDADYDEYEMQEDLLPVLFGRSGLEVRHYETGKLKEGTEVKDYELEWQKNGKYIDWNTEAPEQGVVRLRVTVKGLVFKPRVYYVPFEPQSKEQAPIWRDFEHMKICTSLDGVDDIQDEFNKAFDQKEPSTKQIEIGNDKEKILVDVYRPIILRELSQKGLGDTESHIVEYRSKGDDIEIPLLNCDQFSLRDFSVNGVKEYNLKSSSTVFYNFPTFDKLGFDPKKEYTRRESAEKLTPEIPVDYLKIYISKLDDRANDLYFWNYVDEPVRVASANEINEAGIIFQSLKDNPSPRHYVCPNIKSDTSDEWGDDDWGDGDSFNSSDTKDSIDVLKCFKTIGEHKTYYFLFDPMVKTISELGQIREIVLPLIKECNYHLDDTTTAQLYRFAVEFHFDWMLLPRDLWLQEIENASTNESEKEHLKESVLAFFRSNPKVTDEREDYSLGEFLEKYWRFDNYPKIDDVAVRALKLIMNHPDALNGISDLKEYLKLYDDCRFKFSEMSKAIIVNDNDN
ncbi:MAG: hypothetical protein MJZ16_06900 [Bacteroidales bacterium]|nr:hypothetical protein [Bacteroidales bacterium]